MEPDANNAISVKKLSKRSNPAGGSTNDPGQTRSCICLDKVSSVDEMFDKSIRAQISTVKLMK